MEQNQPGTRVALVSGCSTGIGRVTAQTLAADGWIVYAGLRSLGSNEVQSPTSSGGHVRPLLLDVTDSAQISAAIERIRAQVGRLDALVNNAGIDHIGALEDQSERDLRAVMEVNFFGALALTRSALPLMRARTHSVIVMVSSLSGLIGLPGSSAYCASKFALEGASESLRNEVGRFGVRVCLIEPGGYATAMNTKQQLPADYPVSSPYRPMLDQLLRAAPGGGDPLAVASLVLSAINQQAPHLRYPAGLQAQQVVAHMATLNDAARQRYARSVTGLEWWDAGASRPD